MREPACGRKTCWTLKSVARAYLETLGALAVASLTCEMVGEKASDNTR